MAQPMNIGVPIKDLGPYDIEPLKAKTLGLPQEAWLGNQCRQLEYEVHHHTQSIVLVFTDGRGFLTNMRREGSAQVIPCHRSGTSFTQLSGGHQQPQMETVDKRRIPNGQLARIRTGITALLDNFNK